jgi:hypothetical protein
MTESSDIQDTKYTDEHQILLRYERILDELAGSQALKASQLVHAKSPHIGHKNHLCDLAEAGNLTLEQMKVLVQNPKFICKKCGRAAAAEENLCEPVPL